MSAPTIPKAMFSPKFYPHLLTQKTYNIFWGSRGSTKSEFCAQLFVLRAMCKEYMKLIYSRKDHTHIRESQFSLLKKWIKNFGLSKYFTIYETSMKIVCNLTGNVMVAKGLHDPEDTKGVDEPSHLWMEEITEFDKLDFEVLTASLRTSKTKPQVFATMNPISIKHWTREVFFHETRYGAKDFEPNPIFEGDILLHHSTFRDNPFIDQDAYYKKLLIAAAGNPDVLRVNADGEWGIGQKSGIEFYHAFERVKHVKKVQYNPLLPTHISFDFNAVPYMTGICAQVERRDNNLYIRFFKEYCLKSPDNSAAAVCKGYIRDYGKFLPSVFYYGDASGKNRIAGQGNLRNFDTVEMELARFLNSNSDQVIKRNPNPFKRRDFWNLLLSGHWPNIIIEFDESMEETIADFEEVKTSVEGKHKERITDKKLGISYEKRGHPSDAADYLIVQLLEAHYMSLGDIW